MKKILCLAALFLAPLATFALVQEKKAAQASAPTDDPMMQKMMENMKAFGTPGPAHEVLTAKVGKWNTKWTMTMVPGGQPMSDTGTSDIQWVMDGRYLKETSKGMFQGQAFTGEGTLGYDNLKKKYVSTWIDNMGTGIGYVEGTYDAASKTFTFAGDVPDMIQNKYSKMRMVDKTTDADHWTAQMFSTGPDGKEFQSMEIVYTRAK